MDEYIGMILEEAPVGLREIQQATEDDALMNSVLRRVVTNNWNGYTSTEEPYFLIRDQLTTMEGAILLGNRYVIPEAIRRQVLRLAHEGHPGREAFCDSLRKRVWWPGLTKDASLFAEQCDVCWRRRSNHDQDLQPSELEGVWHKVAVDLVTIESQTCLSIIDYGSRYPEVLPLSSTTAAAVIDRLMEVFARFGLPSELVSDNGPQFVASEMEQFLKRLGIRHTRSSPRYPQSNGMVERLHRVLRERLRGLRPSIPLSRRLQQVLMDIRNSTNRMLGTTPCEALFGRAVHTRIPSYSNPVIVNPQHQILAKAKMTENHDTKRGVRPLKQLKPGTQVILQDGVTSSTKQWTVVEQYGQQVGVSDGRKILLRNRRHVREFYSPVTSESQDMSVVTLPARDPHSSREPNFSVSQESRRTLGSEPPSIATERPPDSTPATVSKDNSDTIPATVSMDNSGGRDSEVPEKELEPDQPGGSGQLFYEGMRTRSGRRVKLTTRAKESYL